MNTAPMTKLMNEEVAGNSESLRAPWAPKETKPTAKQPAGDMYVVHLPLFLPQHLHCLFFFIHFYG